MVVLSPFISVLCHSDWLFQGESCQPVDVVHPGRAWSSSPMCTWHCSLHSLSPGNSLGFLMVWPYYASFLVESESGDFLRAGVGVPFFKNSGVGVPQKNETLQPRTRRIYCNHSNLVRWGSSCSQPVTVIVRTHD